MANSTRKPTAAELDILAILWEQGPSTVRQVSEALGDKAPGYTGVLKLLQIMTAKGMVRRDESERAHVYKPRRPAEQTKRQIVDDMLHRVFQGSASQLMLHALAGRPASPDELQKLRQILDQCEEREDGNAD
jgi:BlaI family transcriptional regulator, penicillinase repressor